MELWNDGFKENGIQSAYFCIDFLVLMQYLGVAKAENGCLMSIIKKCRLNIFCRKCYTAFHTQ
jgi:hypothetical protein